jgi:hypothetical protein
MLKQFNPIRSSSLLQQAIFWPLPQMGAPDCESTLTLVFLSEAPPCGAARAEMAMEAMRRVLMKAIFEFEFEFELVEWVGKASVLDWIGWLDVGEEMVGDGDGKGVLIRWVGAFSWDLHRLL